MQGCHVAPGFEGVSQDVVHQTVRHTGGDGGRWVAVDTKDKNSFCIIIKLWAVMFYLSQTKNNYETILIHLCDRAALWSKNLDYE